MTYRSRYRSRLHIAPVLDLLLCDRTNPRSMVYQLERLQKRVEDLPHKRPHKAFSSLPEQERLILEALTALRLAEAEHLTESNDKGMRTTLDTLLGKVSDLTADVSASVTQEFFNHAHTQQQML